MGYTQLQPACIKQGIKGTMHYSLRPDIHPSSRGHLPIVGITHFLSNLPIILVVELPHHKGICDDNPGRFRLGREKSHRVAGLYNQSLIFGKYLEILLYQPVLHPVLAYASRLTVSHKLIGIQGNLKIQVVVYHYLKSFSCKAFAFIFIYGFTIDPSLRSESVGINPASRLKLI